MCNERRLMISRIEMSSNLKTSPRTSDIPMTGSNIEWLNCYMTLGLGLDAAEIESFWVCFPFSLADRAAGRARVAIRPLMKDLILGGSMARVRPGKGTTILRLELADCLETDLSHTTCEKLVVVIESEIPTYRRSLSGAYGRLSKENWLWSFRGETPGSASEFDRVKLYASGCFEFADLCNRVGLLILRSRLFEASLVESRLFPAWTCIQFFNVKWTDSTSSNLVRVYIHSERKLIINGAEASCDALCTDGGSIYIDRYRERHWWTFKHQNADRLTLSKENWLMRLSETLDCSEQQRQRDLSPKRL